MTSLNTVKTIVELPIKGTQNMILGPAIMPNSTPDHDSLNLDVLPEIEDIICPINPNRVLAKFKYLTFIKTDSIDFTSERFTQQGIKDQKEFADEVKVMTSVILGKGWDLSLGYAYYDTENLPIDGRVKTRAAHDGGLGYVPAAVYAWSPDVTEGEKWLVIGRKNPETFVAGTQINRKTFIGYGLKQIKEYDGLKTRQEIEQFVYIQSGATMRFPKSTNQKDLTIIVNEIEKLRKAYDCLKDSPNTDFVYHREKKDHLAWVNENTNIPQISSKDLWSVEWKDDAERFFVRRILPYLAGETKSRPYLVSYLSESTKTSMEAVETAKKWYKRLDELVQLAGSVLSKQSGMPIDFGKPYIALGFVPQFIDKLHGVDLEGNCARESLIPVEEFLSKNFD